MNVYIQVIYKLCHHKDKVSAEWKGADLKVQLVKNRGNTIQQRSVATG